MEESDKNLVSVVITTRNRSNLVKQAIESVLKQTYKNIEIIVVDDCSTDNTKEVVSYLHSKFKYVRHEKNKGGVAARMTGVRIAQGKYIAFLDDDDQWVAEKLEKQVAVAENTGSNCAVVTCGAKIIRNKNEVSYNIPKIDGNIRDGILLKGLSTIPSCHLFKKHLFDRMGGYDFGLPAHNEHDVWMKMAQMNYETKLINEPLVIIYETNRPRMMTDVRKRIKAFKLFYKKWEKEVYEWYGREKGHIFLDGYMADKILSNGFLVAKNKDIKGTILMLKISLPYLSAYDMGKIIKLMIYLIFPNVIVNILRKFMSVIKSNLRELD